MTKKCFKKLSSYVRDGQLLEDFVLDNVQSLLECLRESNVNVRWLILHNNARNAGLRSIIQATMDKQSLVEFVLKLAQFEN